jgi:aspartate/methionine/tyrosine aminotransferase
MREVYNRRRKLMLAGLKELGFGVTVEPTGAFYVLANPRQNTNPSLAFVMDLVEKAHVGVAPGIDFGANAEGYLRFSYATSEDNIREGLRRVGEYLKRS